MIMITKNKIKKKRKRKVGRAPTKSFIIKKNKIGRWMGRERVKGSMMI